MRNPKWHRDEIILALDLYFSPNRGSIDDKNPLIQELSKTLNALPLFSDRPDEIKFRNENGVTLKLANFLALDPAYEGEGMRGGSKLDEIVFNEFKNNKDRLHEIANEIKAVASDPMLQMMIRYIEEDEQTLNESVQEGNILYKMHKVRERNPSIVKRKKKLALELYGKLECEICSFVFKEYYGDIGSDFIECHHRVPLFTVRVGDKTALKDLALVCSNCHRMLHKDSGGGNVEELKERVTKRPM